MATPGSPASMRPMVWTCTPRRAAAAVWPSPAAVRASLAAAPNSRIDCKASPPMSAEMRLPWVMGALSLRPQPARYCDPAAANDCDCLLTKLAGRAALGQQHDHAEVSCQARPRELEKFKRRLGLDLLWIQAALPLLEGIAASVGEQSSDRHARAHAASVSNRARAAFGSALSDPSPNHDSNGASSAR